MSRKIKRWPSKYLKRVSTPVENFDTMRELVPTMSDLLLRLSGLGLSACQIGVCQRMFIIRDEDTVTAFINPTIVQAGDREDRAADVEGCLSLPGIGVLVVRPTWVEATWTDLDGHAQEGTFTDLSARVFQHELDHLDGITILKRGPVVVRRRGHGKAGYSYRAA